MRNEGYVRLAYGDPARGAWAQVIGNALHYAAGLETPENRAFTEAFARKHKRLPSWFAESAYTAGLWTKTALDAINDLGRHAIRSMQPKIPKSYQSGD